MGEENSRHSSSRAAKNTQVQKPGKSVERLREKARQWDLAKAIYGDVKDKKAAAKTPSKKVASAAPKKDYKTPSKADTPRPEPLRERRSCRVEKIDYQETSSQEEQNSQKSWME